MPLPPRPVLAALTLLLTHAFHATAFASADDASQAYDWSTPLAASASLARANAAQDDAAVTGAYHAATDDERTLLRAFGEQAAAGAELNRACLGRFNRPLPSAAERTGGEAEVRGDEAIVYPGGKRSASAYAGSASKAAGRFR